MERPFSAYKGTEPYIFVSYAHDDAGIVYPEMLRLREAGFNIWYDEGISPGATWRDEVALALTQCSLFLYFVTPRSVASPNCQQELNFSLSRERKMLCVHIEDTQLPPGMELSLSDKQAIMRHQYDENVFVEKLIGSLHEILPRVLEPIAILKQQPVVETNPDEKSIAVLPLENRSSDPENEYLSDGISEEIIAGLSKIDGLRVASEIASFAMKGQQKDLNAMGESLSVETVLSGSVRIAGNRVRINVLLNRVKDGSTLWTERYDREMDDIFELQDDVVRQVIEALKVELGTDQRLPYTDTGTRNPEAYNEFLMGSFEGRKQDSKGWNKARAHLRRAIELDPGFFDAYPRLINANVWLAASEGDPDGNFHQEVINSLAQMERLDPQKSDITWGISERGALYMGAPDNWVKTLIEEASPLEVVSNADQYHSNYVASAYGAIADICRLMALYHVELEFFDRSRSMGYDNLYQRSQGWAA